MRAPRHPCGEKPSVVADIGLRLSEGLQDLKLDQQLAPAREAVANVLAAGSTNVFNAVQGIRDRWAAQRQSVSVPASGGQPLSRTTTRSSVGTPPIEISRADAELAPATTPAPPAPPPSGIRPLSLLGGAEVKPAAPAAPAWGAGIGSFLSSRWSRAPSPQPAPPPPKPLPVSPPSSAVPPDPPTPTARTARDGALDFQPRDLDEEPRRPPRDDDAKSVVGMAL
jgi:hypothetical protein